MKSLLLVILLLIGFNTTAQSEILWHYSYNNKTKTIELTATLKEGWHVYSSQLQNDAGPVATEITFEENSNIIIDGPLMEPTPKESYDRNFNEHVLYFDNEVTFTQRIIVRKKTILKGSVYFMVCNDSMCLPPVEEKFEITVK